MTAAPDELTALDATFLELEQADESAHMHIGAVMIVEPGDEGRVPTLTQLRAQLESRLDLLPRFRQRLSQPRTGGLRWPKWVDDDAFDISHHVRAAALPKPAREAQLREWAGEYFSQRLDRSRPLWESVMLELDNGRWALVTKTHHCMVDGVGSLDIGHVLLDVEPHPPPRAGAGGGRPAGGADPFPDGAVGTALSAGLLGLRAATTAVGAVRTAASLPGKTVGALAHPWRARELLDRSRAMAELIVRDELVAAPANSLNRPIGAARSLAVVEASLADLKRVRRSYGGTVNDVVLAAVAGALRRLFKARDEDPPIGGLRAMVPVNVRRAAEQLTLGNKISSLFVHLPVAEPDHRRRYELQLDEAEALKHGTQAIGSRGIVDLAAHAPPLLHTFLARSLFATRLFNLTITNVPGPQMPLYAFGGQLSAIWPLVPLAAEHALGVAVLSYNGRVFFCLNAATDAVPELDLIATALSDSIDELVEGCAGADPAAVAE